MKWLIIALAAAGALVCLSCSMISSLVSRREEREDPCLYCELWDQCRGENKCGIKSKQQSEV